MMTVKDSMYPIPIGNYQGWLILLSPPLIVADGSRSLIAAKNLRRLNGVFTVLTESELPNSMITGVV